MAKLSPLQRAPAARPDLLAIAVEKESFWVQSPSYGSPKGLGLVGAVPQRGAQGLEAKGAIAVDDSLQSSIFFLRSNYYSPIMNKSCVSCTVCPTGIAVPSAQCSGAFM